PMPIVHASDIAVLTHGLNRIPSTIVILRGSGACCSSSTRLRSHAPERRTSRRASPRDDPAQRFERSNITDQLNRFHVRTHESRIIAEAAKELAVVEEGSRVLPVTLRGCHDPVTQLIDDLDLLT